MNPVETSHTDYQSFLLRVWRDDARNLWRASLQSTATKEVFHFADVDSLLKFLVQLHGLQNTSGFRLVR